MCKVYFNRGSIVSVVIVFFIRESKVWFPIEGLLRHPRKRYRLYLGKNVAQASPWKQNKGREINICSNLRISWGIEVLTHTFLVGALEGRKNSLDSSCIMEIPRISWCLPEHIGSPFSQAGILSKKRNFAWLLIYNWSGPGTRHEDGGIVAKKILSGKDRSHA